MSKTMGDYIKELLKAQNKTQSALAACLGVKRQAMTYKFSKNQWSLDDLKRTAEFFGVKLSDLIAGSGEK